VRPRLTRLAADRLRSYVTGGGHLAFALEAAYPWARTAAAAARRLPPARAVKAVWRRLRRLHRRTRRKLTAHKTKVAVFNRVLRRSGRRVRAVWSYAASPEGFPDDARLVKRGSWSYFLALARADFWIDNQGFPDGLRKRPQTTYVQTWHGSAYKLMGLDQP